MENSIKAIKSWGVTFVGPGEPASSKGELQEAHVIDGVIESSDKRRVGHRCVFVCRVANEVEVPGEPRTSKSGGELSKLR